MPMTSMLSIVGVGNLIDRIYFGVVTDFVLCDIQKEGKREKAAKKARQERAKKEGLVKAQMT
jgi:hypothetical protein